MKKNLFTSLTICLVLLALSLPACTPQVSGADTATLPPTSGSVPAQKTYADPFAYCAAVGTVDTPDVRYTGPQITDEIINGYKIAAGLQDSPESMEMFKKVTIWRCMDSQLYACNYGANLPCSSKANVEKTPSPTMDDYCKANPNAEFIPLAITGHSTIYSWHCVNGAAEVLDQVDKVDAAGYLAKIWYLVQPGAVPQPTASPTPTSAPTLAPTAAPTLAPTLVPTVVLTPTPTLLGGAHQLLFSSTRGSGYDDLYLLDFTSSQLTRLTQGDSNTFPGPFSPDGSKILFTGFGLTHSYVGVMNADGSNPVNLTNAEVDEGFPAWSPDGKSIVFTTLRDGNNEIYVMNADGTQQRRLTNNPHDDFAPAWSPDGTQIAFVSDRDNSTGVYSIYLMSVDGSKVTRLTKGLGSDYTPAWSPDGQKIAFRSNLDGASDIYVIQTDGAGLTNLTNSPADEWSPAWSPDGSLIAFQTNRDGNWEIYVMNSDGSAPHNLTNDPADDQMPYWR
jgi:Tol biopolymer transport system component